MRVLAFACLLVGAPSWGLTVSAPVRAPASSSAPAAAWKAAFAANPALLTALGPNAARNSVALAGLLARTTLAAPSASGPAIAPQTLVAPIREAVDAAARTDALLAPQVATPETLDALKTDAAFPELLRPETAEAVQRAHAALERQLAVAATANRHARETADALNQNPLDAIAALQSAAPQSGLSKPRGDAARSAWDGGAVPLPMALPAKSPSSPGRRSFVASLLRFLAPSVARRSAPGKDPLFQQAGHMWFTVEEFWAAHFPALTKKDNVSKLVLYDDTVDTKCGKGVSAMGPFYCPLDKKTYLPVGFYRDLVRRFNGDEGFARMYVLSHEYAHHVQNHLGMTSVLEASKSGIATTRDRNRISVMNELHADALAGFLSAHAHDIGKAESRDIDVAIGVAKAIGDDNLQMRSRGSIVPEDFNHGTARQRSSWYLKGVLAPNFESLDPFSDPDLRRGMSTAALSYADEMSRRIRESRKARNAPWPL